MAPESPPKKSTRESTLEDYDVAELNERNLGRYLAEIVAEQITAADHRSADRDAEAVEDIYRQELAKLC